MVYTCWSGKLTLIHTIITNKSKTVSEVTSLESLSIPNYLPHIVFIKTLDITIYIMLFNHFSIYNQILEFNLLTYS